MVETAAMIETAARPNTQILNIPGFAGEVKQGVLLAPYTTWNIGGEAQYFVEPNSTEDILALYHYAKTNDLPLTILGRGSNTLIADEGVPGIVICLRNSFDHISVNLEHSTITAQAGCPMPKVAVTAGQHGFAGFEFLISIPGTVGAGVAINAGVGGSDGVAVSSILESVNVLELATGKVHTLAASDLDLSYRHSNLVKRNFWVLEATFKARQHDSPEAIKEVQRELLKKRSSKLPLQRRTSGSVFKQHENGKAAGWYFDQAGLKGRQVGDAMVSLKHANWIENTRNAKAQEVKELMQIMQAEVETRFGIRLEREVRFMPE
jgi:UDP-N-acetylmuramate dehydrogenase